MTVQKILSQQIANSGGTAGQVLVANSTGVTWGDANNALNLGGVAAASYVNTAGAYTRTGVTTFNANAVIGPLGELVLDANAGIYANGSLGTAGQVLTSNATTVYWSTIAGVNVAAQYAWTNTQSFSAVVTHTANVSVNGAIIANGGAGTAGQVLTSSAGGNVYWAAAAGGFTNGQSIAVSNLAITGTVSANGGTGTAGQALISSGTGNTYWGVSSPGYNYSARFNGTNSYLTLPANSAYAFGTGDFTIEFWAYFTATPQSRIVNNRLSGGAASGTWSLNLNANGGVFTEVISGEPGISFTYTFAQNTWVHIALVRISNTTTIYVNGVNCGSGTQSTNFSNSSYPLSIGVGNGDGVYFPGFLSNLRIVKGTGVYTGNFTVPTSPLSAITNTVLLICNSITLSDQSTTYATVTNNGGVTTTATLSPFTSTTVSIPTASLTTVRQQFTGDGSTTQFNVAGGYTPNSISVFVNGVLARNGSDVTVTSGSYITFTGITPPAGSLIDVIGTVPTTYSSITPVAYSGYLSSTSASLAMPSNAAFGYGTGDFTIEMFVYITDTTVAYRYLYTGGGIEIRFGDSGFGARLQFSVNNVGGVGAVWSCASTLATLANSWQHIAFTRQNGVCRAFINGVQQYLNSGANPGSFPYTSFTDSTSIASNAPSIGGNAASVIGYYSNVRIVKGVAVYTAAFNPITSPLQAVQSAGVNIAAITGTQTSLLTCNGPTIVDGSTNAFTITNTSVSVSTAFVPTFTNVTINAATTATTYSVQALIVGGGGAGGAGEAAPGGDGGGGGGAGGVIQNNINLSVGTVYSVVIGAGGSSGGAGAGAVGGTGGNSTFAGFTAYGGGGGGTGDGGVASYGGSGGGAGNNYSSNNYGGGCTYLQGYPGGDAAFNNTTQRGGSGGGGAGGYGGYRSSNSGANGGSGIGIGITGSTVFYAGGGAGGGCGTNGGGTGGNGFGVNQGGGGNGASSGVAATTGTTNTGGGGGGGCGHNTGATYSNGAAGGSGVVILSIPTANYTGTKTGSPTVTTSGSYTILTFTASGSYTA